MAASPRPICCPDLERGRVTALSIFSCEGFCKLLCASGSSKIRNSGVSCKPLVNGKTVTEGSAKASYWIMRTGRGLPGHREAVQSRCLSASLYPSLIIDNALDPAHNPGVVAVRYIMGPCAVQPVKAMTFKEMVPASATGWVIFMVGGTSACQRLSDQRPNTL